MATLITTANLSSPTSLQLRFRRGLRGPPLPRSIRTQFRARIRLICAAGAQAKSGSWSGAEASPDSFAGWSGTESVDGGDEPHKKGGFAGVLGVGLAGFFFVAGVGFASLSLFNRTTTGVKQHVELLKAEQEVPLTSDDRSVKTDQVTNEPSAVLPDEESKIVCNLGCETDINNDSFLPIKVKEDDIGEGLDNIHSLDISAVQHIKSTDKGVDANNIPVPSVSDDSLPESSAYDAAESFSDASICNDSHSTVSSDSRDLVIDYDVNVGTVNHVDLNSYSSDSINHTTDNQEGNLSAEETVDSKVSADSFSRYGGQIPSEATPSTLIAVESSKIVDYDIKDVTEPAASISKQQDSEPGSMPQLPAELSTSDPVVLDINDTAPSEKITGPDFDKNEDALTIAHSLSVLSELNGSVSDIRTQSQMGRSFSFESLPEKTFSHAGIPAPCRISATLQLPPGRVLIPAVVEQVQGQAMTALQVLKVIEADVRPGDICTRREYARWLVAASSALSRNTISKVYPAMYIENVTELAYDDITPEDPDFSYIQGLAEAGIISSKLSRSDPNGSFSEHHDSYLFCPESPLSRQDLVSWKMAIEKRLLPEVNRNDLYRYSGYIDIDKIDPDAWPALFADLFDGERGITSLAFGHTRLFQPNKPVTKAQAAIALATGDYTEIVGEELTRIEVESLSESAVNAHTALVEEVKKDLNMNFEKELSKEREKLDAVEKLAEDASLELERLRAEREDKNNALVWGRAAVESEMEVLSRLRHEVEEQLQELMSNKVQISFERERIDKLGKEAESKNQVIVQLQYELEVERKALSMARAWAEEEAKRAREQAKALEEARDRWERHEIKAIVDADLQDEASIEKTWLTAREQQPAVGTINRAETLVAKLRVMSAEIKVKSSDVIEKIIQKIVALISALKQRIFEASKHAKELHNMSNAKMAKSVDEIREKASVFSSRASRSIEEIRDDASEFSSGVRDKARRTVEDCKGSFDKITQRFKT